MDLAELQDLLSAADAAALLVPPRILRRVIKRDRRLAGIGLQVPHRKSHVVSRESLLQIVDWDELGLVPESVLPDLLILIARPDPDELASVAREQTLIKYWRLLFHCRVHVAMQQLFSKGALTDAEVLRRIHALGEVEFAEVGRVLRQDKYLLPPDNPRSVYEEFAAVYLELRFFVPALVPHNFPSIDDFDRVDDLLAQDIHGADLFAKMRLQGAPDPVTLAVTTALPPVQEFEGEAGVPVSPRLAEDVYRGYIGADRAEALGNVVRSAILLAEAAQAGPRELSDEMFSAANMELSLLTERLQGVLQLSPGEADQWHQALLPLLENAARGIWPVAARLLYDLQRACIDHELGIYAVDLMEWALSLGRRPIKRPLSNQREVLIVKHLRKAVRRLPRVRLAAPDRQRLDRLLATAIERSEKRLRAKFRPLIAGVFDKVGMKAHNYPEQIARNKLKEELLDRITERGFLNIGDLRDAISRNNLKLPDLHGPAEFFRGDRLLRIDQEFGVVLDGVYRRGEIYMRWLQRFSSLGFGTPVGRFLTRYLALPFGGAFVVLEGLQHLVGHQVKAATGYPLHLMNGISVALVGLFFLSLLYVEPFRRSLSEGVGWIGRGLRAVFIDLPGWVLRQPVIHNVLQSHPMALFQRYLLTPLLCTALAASLFVMTGSERNTMVAGTVAIFLATVLLFNSRLGRDVEEACTDWLIRGWEHVRTGILPGLFRAVMDFFKWVVERFERLLYAVDEWLRFRSGEGKLSLVVKTVLSLVWFVLTYILRIYINLLIEPTFNPIKHFPVVTVAHKIMLPLIPTVFALLAAPLMPLGPWVANGFATVTIFFVPGIFGFLVWEFKENWRLYQANRSATLKPIVIGHHGETMLRLMKPGLHSGTLPKIFIKLRKAERRAARPRYLKAAHRQRQGLHHVEQSVRHFVERELVKLLEESKGWGQIAVAAGAVRLGSNRIRIEICCPQLGKDSLWIAFEEKAGWLLAGIPRPGWLGTVSRGQARVLKTALAGFYKLAGVQLVREEIAAELELTSAAFDIIDDGLVVWPRGDFQMSAIYDLGGTDIIPPRNLEDPTVGRLPALNTRRLLYTNVPVTWDAWVETWELDQVGKEPVHEILEKVSLLPQLNASK